MVADRRTWTLADLRAMPQQEQVTRHICVEGWGAIGKSGGVPFAHFLKRVGADTTAKYVGFKCADDYYISIDMATALRPQTNLALTYDGQVLPAKYGYPVKLRMPTKLGLHAADRRLLIRPRRDEQGRDGQRQHEERCHG